MNNLIAKFITNEFKGELNNRGIGIEDTRITPAHIHNLCSMIHNGAITRNSGKIVLQEMFDIERDIYGK